MVRAVSHGIWQTKLQVVMARDIRGAGELVLYGDLGPWTGVLHPWCALAEDNMSKMTVELNHSLRRLV